MTERIAFIGMGEAGSAIVAGWGEARRGTIRAYDIKSDDAATAPEMRDRYEKLGLLGCASSAEAVEGAELVFSTVTADQAVAAARTAAPSLAAGAYWLDCNSCAPSSKLEAAAVVEAAGGRYVDVAVMQPIHPKRHLTPLLVSGPHSAAALALLAALPMAVERVEGEIGRASAIKMIRSVIVKGMEGLAAECALAAVAAGVEEEVLASLATTYPGIEWPSRVLYNLERAITHGVRRAAEMDEVARTLADLGLPNGLSIATAAWERRLAGAAPPVAVDQGLDGVRRLGEALLPKVKES